MEALVLDLIGKAVLQLERVRFPSVVAQDVGRVCRQLRQLGPSIRVSSRVCHSHPKGHEKRMHSDAITNKGQRVSGEVLNVKGNSDGRGPLCSRCNQFHRPKPATTIPDRL